MKLTIRALSHLIVTALVLNASTTQAQPAVASDVEKTRGELKSLMEKWEEHRSQRIVVLDIEGLSDVDSNSGELSRLESRLKTLLNKTRSNREWKSYWKEEGRLAGDILSRYERLSSTEGEGRLSAESRRLVNEATAADIKAQAKQKALNEANAAQKRILSAVQDAFNDTNKRIQDVSESTKALQARTEDLGKQIEKTKKALKTARSQKAQADLGAKLDELSDELKKAADEQAKAEADLDTITLTKKALDAAVSGKKPRLEGVREADQKVISSYLEAVAVASKAAEEQKTAQEKASTLQEFSQRLVLEDKRYRGRPGVLKSWQALANRKVSNQETYYKAIQSDIEAVRDRLRSFRKTKEPDEVDHADDVCSRPLADQETSLKHHRECVKATKAEIEALKETLGQRKAADKLTKRLLASTKNLLVAQRLDEDLVREEHDISDGEAKRAATVAASESVEWREIWKVYATKAASKITSLATAVVTSKETKRALNVNLGLLDSETSLLDEKITSLSGKLEERDNFGEMISSIFATGLELVQIGWPALIYLFLAFLVLRTTNRVSGRITSQASDEDEEDEDVKTLQAELDQAEREKDNEKLNQIRDQMTILESRRRDMAQRVTTLTNIARGGIKAVVYVATTLLVLDALTVDIGPILGGAAIFGLAISFGSQSLVKDVVTGFFILLENQYAVGDVVSINGQAGVVERITLRRTVLRDLTGGVHNIPNGAITGIINKTQGWARTVFHLGVAYGTDMDKVAEVVNKVGDEMYADEDWNAKILEPPRYVGITAFNDSDITFRAMFKTHTFENWAAEREFNQRIKVAFEAANITIPFPQREVTVIKELG